MSSQDVLNRHKERKKVLTDQLSTITEYKKVHCKLGCFLFLSYF